MENQQAFDPKQKAFSLFEEFKAFAFKGNVIDLAVGVVIGTAFGKIVTSLVNNIIMPAIGFVLPGKRGYEGWAITYQDKKIPFGLFIGDIVNFLIVAFALFLFISKFLGWLMHHKKEEQAKPTPTLTKDQELLVEIRDLLREQTTEK